MIANYFYSSSQSAFIVAQFYYQQSITGTTYIVRMDMQENFTCPLCLQLAKQAVQSSCCTKIYCLSCIEGSFKKYGQCPCCRSTSMSYSPSRIARKVISEIRIPCEHCEQKVQLGEMEKHLRKCPKVRRVCKICNKQFSQQEIPKHTANEHQKEAKQFLIKYMTESSLKKVNKIDQSKINLTQHDYFSPLNNKFNRKASLGTPSKYYCGGELLGKCSCCNGHCGPVDGQNCDGCMELDVKRWNLAKTYLVNPQGYVCQVIRAQGSPRVCCFRILGSKKLSLFSKSDTTSCKLGSPCNPCAQVQNSINIGRYKSLY